MEFSTFAYDTLSFFIRLALFVFALVIVLKALSSPKKKTGELKVKNLTKRIKALKNVFNDEDSDIKEKKKPKKEKAEKLNKTFVLEFKGSVNAAEVNNLKQEVDAVLQGGNPDTDKVIIKITSPGGAVTGYGYAAAQIERLREGGFYVTAAVDEVAASGGYLMASVANKIIASKFAIIGSIGVISQMPNFSKLLEKVGVDYEQITAGKYKRTLSMVKPNDDEAREKFGDELKAIHDLFKRHVQKYRPDMDIEKIATGEYWLGEDALELGLIDGLKTSDDLIIDAVNKDGNQVLEVKFKKKEPMGLRLKSASADILFAVFEKIQAKVSNPFTNIR